MTLPFDHAGIESLDIEADVALYTLAMGLRLVRWGSHRTTGRRIAMMHDGMGVKLELIEVAVRDGAWAHIAFRSSDVATDHDRAVAAGFLSVQGCTRIEPALATTAFVRSPSGTLVQLIQYDDASPDLVTPEGVTTAPWRCPTTGG
ncbi:hypothetical protein BVC93_13765 [Mycobacterium sp. MS1601]|uniref:VOC family protein n=1 Tax=Mycobacterium sp. MS1601 TaxID=1936029 RepID=UPI0009794F6D|nr:VOC family protein [Mycobacterium sp. MS1601]AQA03305.1 hypothetical protein BVC93_13765 [Mycobacterium sp. MS1601]